MQQKSQFLVAKRKAQECLKTWAFQCSRLRGTLANTLGKELTRYVNDLLHTIIYARNLKSTNYR
jgi:hypothetical protein